jgi:hypothetical protein
MSATSTAGSHSARQRTARTTAASPRRTVQPSHGNPGWNVPEASLALSPTTAGTSAATAAPRQAAALVTSPAGKPPSTTTAQRTGSARVANAGSGRNSATHAGNASTASMALTPHDRSILA